MTKLTALELYVLADTLLHSLSFGEYWNGSAKEEARVEVVKKLQKIMSEIEVELSVGETNETK